MTAAVTVPPTCMVVYRSFSFFNFSTLIAVITFFSCSFLHLFLLLLNYVLCSGGVAQAVLLYRDVKLYHHVYVFFSFLILFYKLWTICLKKNFQTNPAKLSLYFILTFNQFNFYFTTPTAVSATTLHKKLLLPVGCGKMDGFLGWFVWIYLRRSFRVSLIK